VVCRRSLPSARLLARSLTEHCSPSLSVLVLDDPVGESIAADEPFELVTAGELTLGQRELQRLTASYDPSDAARCVVPWLLTLLLTRGDGPVAYVGAGMQVFAPLGEVEALVRSSGVVLSAYRGAADVAGRPPRDLASPGTHDPDFVALSSAATGLLEEWKSWVLGYPHPPGEGNPIDQGWIDEVAASFDHAVITDPGFDVGYWNAGLREWSRAGPRVMVDGRPLALFNFNGFSPLQPHRLGPTQGDRGVDLAALPVVARLCLRYARDLLAEGYLEAQAAPLALNYTSSGHPIDQRMREVYRSAVRAASEPDARDALPDPFTEAGVYERWMFDPTDIGPGERVSRYFKHLYDTRPDLQELFPDPGAEGDGFEDWMALGTRHEGTPPLRFLPPFQPPISTLVTSEPLAEGVNVLGYVDAEDGVGEVARQFAVILTEAGIDHALVPYRFTPSRRRAEIGPTEHPPVFDVNLMFVNADEIPMLAVRMGPDYPRPRHRVAMWAWEIEEFPAWMAASDHFADEIWTYSEHAARALRAAVSKPVHVVPPTVPLVAPTGLGRADLGLPEGFLFMFCFSYFSVFERKNPLAVIEAFKQAFRPGEGPSLVLKSIHGWHFEVDRARLRQAAGHRPDIVIIDAYESPARQRAFIENCDVYVSLHRAEGFGLTMAEAMSMGKPVIATGYSGNLEFMSSENSLLVPFEPVSIPLGCDPYPPGSRWAQPDIPAAAGFMRALADDPEMVAEIGDRAHRDIARHHSTGARTDLVRGRLTTVRKNR